MPSERCRRYLAALTFSAAISTAQPQNIGAVGTGVSISFQNAMNSENRGVSVRFFVGGSLTVRIAPAAATAATYSINPTISGFPLSAPTPTSRSGIPPGHYKIVFDDLSGWNTPAPQEFDIISNLNTSLVGTYTPKTAPGIGTLSISLNTPAGGSTISSLSDPTFYPITRSGSVVAQLPAGKYQIHFTSLHRYFTPAPQTVTVNAGDSTSIGGLYQRLLVIAFTGFNNSPIPPNCFAVHQDIGGGIEYTIPQPAVGMTQIVPEIQSDPGVPALKPGTTGAAFAFYGTNNNQVQNGNACLAPNGTSIDHSEAEKWLADKNPTSWDKIVVIGHSYGGNRARLFVEQLRMNRGWTADILITVDAINWATTLQDKPGCDLYFVMGSSDIFGAAAQACNQTGYTARDIPSSSARSTYSFFQTKGVGTFPVIMGYIVPGATGQEVSGGNDHVTIDKDPGVHQTIRQLMLDLVRNPTVSTTAGQAVRSGTLISVPVTLSVTGLNSAMSVAIAAASLNGVPATNLSGLAALGDMAAGAQLQVVLSFPGTAARAGQNAILTLNGSHSSGQRFTMSKRLLAP